MAEITNARFALAAARAAREVALRDLHTAEANADFWREPDGSFPVVDQPLNPEIFATIQGLQPALDAANAALAAATAAYDSAAQAYAALAVAEPLFPTDNTDPILLLPVRLEAIYVDQELRIRVYPDDAHVDSHEPALTDREHFAGTTYWREVFAAGNDTARLTAAWVNLTGATSGERAAWVRQALTPTNQPPSEPVFPAVEQRPEAWTRAAHTLLLPDHFEFSAYREGTLVWRLPGGQIPDTLPLGIAPQSAEAAEADALPFDPASRWLVDFEKAVAVGMGLVAPLADATERFDLLTVVGVGPQDAATGGQRVETALTAHAFSSGLSILPTRTPTNNTPGSRSGWRSRSTPTAPEVAASRQASYDPASPQDAARLARALGVDGRPVLAARSDPADQDEALLEKFHRLQADVLGFSQVWRPAKDVSKPGWLATTEPWYAEATEHFSTYVRARGPLPPLRIGRQPYGVLPVSSMDLWNPGDDKLAWYVGSFQSAFAEYLGRAIQVGEGADQDATLLDLLSRQANPERLARWGYFNSGMEDRPPPAAIGAIPATLALAWQRARVAPPPDSPEQAQQPDWIEPFPTEIPAELKEFLALRPMAQLLVLADETIAQMRRTHTGPIPAELEAQWFPIREILWQLQSAPTLSQF
ncbi:MAG: hypothetical protein QOH03_1703, partial [Kribbellaceae bacterium]|nr:hypothetical protein [Kribbellaceae bacterium]